MSMQVTLPLLLDKELFQLEEVAQAEQSAVASAGQLYSWKTTGQANWLEAGLSITDVLGIVVLPQGLPNVIDMADDMEEE